MQQENSVAPIPHEWYCPISQELMRNPTMAADGFTYEKQSIEKWLTKSHKSPMTNIDLTNLNLMPNHALRHTIEDYLEKKKQNNMGQGQKKVKYQNIDKKEIPNIGLITESIIDGDSYIVKCEITPPPLHNKQNTRHPCSLICILDVSESMDTDSVLGGKDVESHGFSRLDLVKHSINTMIQFMGDEDEMGIVIFSNAGRVQLPLRKTTAGNKNLIKKTVASLTAHGSTNIWDGLKVSLDLLKDYHQRNATGNVFMVLLTDGEPNLNPPRGIVPTFKKFLDLQKIPIPNVHVFGYGYELDSQLLSDIAQTGYGTYSYIPDCSMVGTVFVNFMASAMSTVTNRLSIEIIDVNTDAPIQEIIGFNTNKNMKYNLGVLQYGQNREFFIRYNEKVAMGGIGKLCNVKIKFDTKKESTQVSFDVLCSHHCKDQKIMTQSLIRMKYIKLLQALKKSKKSEIQKSYKQIDQFYQRVQSVQKENGTSEFIEALLKQLKNEESENEGQVSKSFEKEQWYTKWGKHYIPSLYLAHLMQTCTNFKDPALQQYGGELFEENRNNMDTIFIKMAPPQPSAKKVEKLVYKPVPDDMHDYYDNWGGCVHEECQVEMFEQGKLKKVKDLKKGDILKGGKVIKCIVKSNIYDMVDMVVIDKLIITPWHPVKIQDSQKSSYVWKFPAEVRNGRRQKIFIESYYNFVIQDLNTKQISPSFLCEGIECIGLGHGLDDNHVVSHQYFGHQVLNDLKADLNWQKGIVVVRRQHRDLKTKLVNKLEFEENEITINVVE